VRKVFVIRQDELENFRQASSLAFEEHRLSFKNNSVDQAAFNQLLTKFVESGSDYLLFLGSHKTISKDELAKFVDTVDADPLIAGFQYAWENCLDVYFVPFLTQDFFCVKRKFVIDFLMTNSKQDRFTGEIAVLEASFRASRAGYRFHGHPEIPYRLPTDFLMRSRPDLKHYDAIISNYINSQDRAWNEFSSQFHFDDRPLRILLDLNHLSPSHNGALVAGHNIVKSIYKNGLSAEVTICSSPEVKDFLHIETEFPKWRWLSSDDAIKHHFEIAFDFGQPWFFQRVPFFNKNCFSVFFLFYDVIAWDCLYIRQVFPDLDRLWKYWTRFASGLVFDSLYTRELIATRFPDSKSTPGATCLLSTDFNDYKTFFEKVPGNSNAPLVAANQKYFLIFGNFFHHKYVEETIETILPLLGEDESLVIVGAFEGRVEGKLNHLNSGQYSSAQISDLYQRALAVLYPSHYEGFGLPVPEAMAHDKIVFARESPLIREIMTNWNGPGGVIPFTDNEDLKYKFTKFKNLEDGEILKGQSSQKNNWDRVAMKAIGFVTQVHQTKENRQQVENRFRTFDLLLAVNTNISRKSENPFQLFNELVERH
jgi:hypothetical protein